MEKSCDFIIISKIQLKNINAKLKKRDPKLIGRPLKVTKLPQVTDTL